VFFSASTLFTASTQSTAACFDAGSSPPTASSTVAAVSILNSTRDLPLIHSVSAELAAIDAVQPRVWNLASATQSFSKRTESLSISPQAGFVTSTTIAGGASVPTLRGF